MVTHPTPTFSIYTDTGDKVQSLIDCHIARQKLSRNNLPAMICAADGIVYQAIYDCRIPEGVQEFEAIISFQKHTYGKFAIVRIAKEGK